MPPASVRPTTWARHSARYASSRNRQSVVMASSHERSFDVGAALEPRRHREVLRAQELRVEQLRLITRAVIGENGDDGMSRAQFLGELDCAADVDTRRAAEAQAFVLQQVENDRYRLFIRNDVGLVDLDIGDDGRDAPKPYALGDRVARRRFRFAARKQIVHREAARVGDADNDVLLLLAQIGGDTGDRAAGPDRTDETVDLAVGLPPDFRTGRDVVCLAIVKVVPLVGENNAIALARTQLLCQAPTDVLVIVRVGVGGRRYLD